MRLLNRLRILRLVRRGPVARSELAVRTGLTRAGISIIVADLIKEGLLVEAGRRGSAGGRKPVLLEPRPDYAFALGLTISRAGAEVGVVNFRGELLWQTPLGALPSSRTAALLEIKQVLRRTLASRRLRNRKFLGLGISTPGPVDVMTGTILNPPNFELWQGVRICDELRSVAGQRVFLANNSQALTMAEKAYGRGRDCASFVLLVVENGIGAGIVRGEEVFAGWRGFGSEVGHTSIDCDGPECECGLRGCVELYASVPNVLRKLHKRRPRVASWNDFIDRVHTGDAVCRRLLEEQARALAVALVNVMNTLELEAIVLTGDILYRGEMLRKAIERQVNLTAMNRRLRHIPVYLSALDNHSAVMAAAGIAVEEFFEGDTEALAGSSPDPAAATRLCQMH
jgi:N-acetylglucosamine repressor